MFHDCTKFVSLHRNAIILKISKRLVNFSLCHDTKFNKQGSAKFVVTPCRPRDPSSNLTSPEVN